MNKSPAIVFVNRWNKGSLNNKSKKSRDKYYKTGDWLNYIMRPDAVFNLKISDEEVLELNKLRTGNKSQKALYEKKLIEIQTDFKTTGLYGKSGTLSIEEVKNLKKQMKKLDDEQILWDGFVSFSQDFIKEAKLFTPDKIEKAVNTEIKAFFEKNNMDHNKMEWFFTMHTNTDNNHIHLGFFEKEPTDYEIMLDKTK